MKKNLSALFTKNNTDMNKPIEDTSELLAIIDDFRKSKIEVEVTSVNGTEKKLLTQLIDNEIAKGKNVIFTFTPGPFLDPSELPQDWMKFPVAKGCTNQICAFDEKQPELDAVVFNVNKQKSAYQQQWLKQKNLANIFMISDADNKLEKAFNLPLLDIPDARYPNATYFNRFTFDFKKNGLRSVIVPVNQSEKANAFAHVNDVKDFQDRMQECIVKL